MSSILCDVLGNTFSLLSQKLCERLSDDDKPKVICRKLESALGEYESNVGNDLNAAFVFLRTAVADLEICFENLEKSGEPSTSFDDAPNDDHRLIFYTPLGSQLDRELRKIKSRKKAKDKFSFASNNFRKANEACSQICENTALGLQERITATKVLVITEILGNLENLNDAAKNCMRIISELHECREIQSLLNANPIQTKFKRFVNWFTNVEFEESKNITSVVKISEAVFTFRKKFIRKPVPIFDWPVVQQEENPQTLQSIFGPSTMRTTPDLTTSIENNELEINTRISAINCKGEVFVKYKGNWFAIVRIAADGVSFPFWSLTKEKANELEIVGNLLITSISVNGNGCKFTKNSDDLHQDCENNLFVLATYTSDQQIEFLLFVIDVHGKLLHTAKLTFLPRRDISETASGKIFCTKDKLLIFDIYRGKAYLCDKTGELEKPLTCNVAGQKPETLMASVIADVDKILILEKPNKIHFYNISEDSFLADQEFEAKYEVNAIAYNRTLNEVNLLCRSGLTSRTYHLMRYEKTGKLKQDIKLQNDLFDFSCASLVSHPSGPVVLFDNNRLLYLQ